MKEKESVLEIDNKLFEDNIESIINSTLENEIEDLPLIDDSIPSHQNRNGKFKLTISSDDMSVKATLYPPVGNGTALTAFDIFAKLHKLSVAEFTIQKKVISDTIKKLAGSLQVQEDVEIASGVPASPHIPSYILFSYKRDRNKEDKPCSLNPEGNSRIDHKNKSSICLVKKGTILAKKIDEVEGVNGKTVKGVIIPFQTARVKTIMLGKNIKLEENNNVIAVVDGEVTLIKNELSVSKILKLKEGVNYKTGHIKFPGTVIVQGEVEDDFNIIAEDNIYVQNTLTASHIYSGGDLLVEGGGIIGRPNNRILVKHKVKAKYIENGNLEALGDIQIEKSVLNSNIKTNGSLSFHEKGKIIGGSIYTRNGLDVEIIGNDSGAQTEISCGTDFTAVKKLIMISTHRDNLIVQKNKQLAMDKKADTSEFDSLILKCELSSQHILQKMIYNEEAKVHIRGTVFPGTVIDICHIRKTVKTPLSNGFFYLKKEDGSISFQAHS